MGGGYTRSDVTVANVNRQTTALNFFSLVLKILLWCYYKGMSAMERINTDFFYALVRSTRRVFPNLTAAPDN